MIQKTTVDAWEIPQQLMAKNHLKNTWSFHVLRVPQ
jgi:hypothetical protein